MRISDWSSDVCSSDLALNGRKSNGLHSLLGRWQAQRPGVTKSAVNPAVVLYKNSFLFIWYIYLCPLFAFHSKTGPVVHSSSLPAPNTSLSPFRAADHPAHGWSVHRDLPTNRIIQWLGGSGSYGPGLHRRHRSTARSEEHTSELQ